MEIENPVVPLQELEKDKNEFSALKIKPVEEKRSGEQALKKVQLDPVSFRKEIIRNFYAFRCHKIFQKCVLCRCTRSRTLHYSL